MSPDSRRKSRLFWF